MRRLIATRKTTFTKNSKFRGGGKNHASKVVGPKGRKVSVPRSADSFKSKTDNT